MKRSDWRTYKISEVAFFQEGPGLRTHQWTSEGMKVINVTNILTDGSVDISNTDKYVSQSEFESRYSHFAVEENDIVVASSGNTYGKVGRIRAEHLPLMMNTSVIRFHSADRAVLDEEYLYSFLRSPDFRGQIEAFVTGGAQPNFGPSHLKQMTISLPSIKEQRTIAGIITAYDNLIENNRRRMKLLEEAARLLYQEWFVRFRFPGHEHSSLVDSHLGKIPAGSKCLRLRDVCYRITDGAHGSPKSVDSGLPMASMKDMDDWGLDLSSCRLISDDDFSELVRMGCKPEIGDVLVAKDGASYLKYVFVIDEATEVVLLSSIALLRPNKEIQPYLLCFILHDPFNKQRLANFVSGVAIPRIILKDFSRFAIVVPPKQLQNEWWDEVQPIVKLIHNLRKTNEKLRVARDLLLPRLMTGDIPVKIETTREKAISHKRFTLVNV